MRVKRGVSSHKRHKKLHEAVKGYRMTKRRLIRVAHEAFLHAGQYAFSGRRKKKSDFRELWITRISHAVKEQGLSYSVFINKMKKGNIVLDRKALAWLIRFDPEAFTAVVEKAKQIS